MVIMIHVFGSEPRGIYFQKISGVFPSFEFASFCNNFKKISNLIWSWGESDPYTSHPKNLYDDYIIVFNICSMVM